jgi:hypothetical protein
MSGECDICGEHTLDCICRITQEELERFAINEVIEAFERLLKNPSEHDCQEG